jgi:hypothetical protein
MHLLRKDWTALIFSEGRKDQVNIVLTQYGWFHCG